MSWKLMALPIVLGASLAFSACTTPDTVEEQPVDESVDPSAVEEAPAAVEEEPVVEPEGTEVEPEGTVEGE